MPITVGNTAITFNDGTTQSTAASGGVTSLNGSTGALKGATLVNTTTFSAASTIDVTSGLSNAGFYLICITGTLSNTNSATEYYFRTSTDSGSTFNAGNTDYKQIFVSDGSVTNNNQLLNVLAVKNADVNVWTHQSNILLYTGTASSYASAENWTLCINQSTGNNSANSTLVSGIRTANGQVNAFRIIRLTGTATTTGAVYTYYLGV